MSFAMKYDKNGRPIGLAETAAEIQRPTIDQATVYVQPAEALDDLPVVEPEQQEAVEDLQQEVAAAEQKAVEEKAHAESIARQAAQESFRAVREKAERMEKERNEYMRMLEEEKSKKSESSDFELGDDDLVEAKHFKKYQKELQAIKKQTEQARYEASMAATELKIKSQFPDFDKVVSNNTINALKETYPELAQSLSTNTDMYSKAVSAYTIIKNLGLYKEDTFMADKIQAQKNASKPKPTASIAPQKGNSALSQANVFAEGLTPELMKQMRVEMESARKLY